MKILVVAAMPNELKAIKEGVKSAGLKVNLDIDYLCGGIGNYEIISSLEHYLVENKEPTFIWNIGICGYWNPKNEDRSEPIQVASIINIHTEKEMIIPPFLQVAPMKTCFSSEKVVLQKPEFQKEICMMDDEMYFDMESWGISFVASKYKYPCLILKIPFDFIGCDENVKNYNYKDLSGNIIDALKHLAYHEYLGKIVLWINEK